MRTSLIATVFVLCACQPAGVPFEQWCEATGDRELCLRQRGCGLAAPGARCEDQLRSVVSPPRSPCSPALRDALDAGRVRFDGLAAERCEAALATGCGPAPETCSEILVGAVPLGEACRTDFECVSGTFCDLDAQCPGVCRPQVGAGEVTTARAACAPGLVASTGADGGVQCLTLGAEGDDCSNRPCASSLACSGERVCRPAVAVGGACDTARPCGPSALCVAGTCTRFAGRGEPCATQFLGSPMGAQCQLGLACRDGVCGELLRAGEACGVDPGRCQAGTWCIDDVCRTQGAEGSSCQTLSDCARLWCIEGTCSAGRKSGEACGSGRPCVDGLACDSATQQCAQATCGP